MAVKRLVVKVEYLDKLETRPAKARERALLAELPRLLTHAKKRAPGWAKILREVNPSKIKTRAALAALPEALAIEEAAVLGRIAVLA